MSIFKVGQRVTPVSKNVIDGEQLSDSNCWRAARDEEQNFLYIVRTPEQNNTNYYTANILIGQCSGDWFMETDLVAYDMPIGEEHREKLESHKQLRLVSRKMIDWIEKVVANYEDEMPTSWIEEARRYTDKMNRMKVRG